ncbi:MAG: hypothetical protein Kow00121_64060 [Elainellaceae cyanobacterium]
MESLQEQTTHYLDSSAPDLSIQSQQRLLRFPLDRQDHVLVPLEQIVEILNVNTAEILPVPQMSRCLLGICRWRGEMLWIVDFNELVGYPSVLQIEPIPLSLMVLVTQVNHHSLGVGVRAVNDIELHDLQQLQSAVAGLFSPELLPLVQGTLPESYDAVLNLQAITQCPLWKTLYGKEP